MLTINFLNLNEERFKNLDFTTFQALFELMLKNRHKLFDDEHFVGEKPYIQRVYEIIEEHLPYFWLFYDTVTGEILGFCYFYDVVPRKGRIHSAFASICFKKEAFGPRAYVGAKRLLGHMFRVLKVFKIKAECFSDNILIPNFLMRLGFEHEATLKSEAVVQNRLKNIEIWSIFNGEIYGPNAQAPQGIAPFRKPLSKGPRPNPPETVC